MVSFSCSVQQKPPSPILRLPAEQRLALEQSTASTGKHQVHLLCAWRPASLLLAARGPQNCSAQRSKKKMRSSKGRHSAGAEKWIDMHFWPNVPTSFKVQTRPCQSVRPARRH